MCAICGIVSFDPRSLISEALLVRMRDRLTHRGPDDAGQYLAPGIALGSRRLAILDLSSRGRMPMKTLDGRFWIIHNGEVYNYRDLRCVLERRGYTFASNTDTEVILNLFVADGPAMLDQLNGMFCFAIWDNEERSLFIARDRLGVKPVYYSIHEDALYFASEEKSLFAAGVPLNFDHETWEELLCFRYVAGERTPYIGVRRLMPGHYMIVRGGKTKIVRWWNLSEKAQALRERLPTDPVAWYRETFDDAVNIRRISDVPIGVLLSGGLDSSSVAASLSKQAGDGVASFTVRFSEPDYDEGPLARKVAERWRLNAHELYISADNLIKKLRQAAWYSDEPLVHGNDLHLFAISEYAKSRVTVLLSGEGADETLGGYVRYQPLRYGNLLATAGKILPTVSKLVELNSRLRKLSRFLELNSLDQFVLFNACETLPQDLIGLGFSPQGRFLYRKQVLAEAHELYPNDYARQAMYSDQHTFLCSVLDRNDRMTMGASIECRVPFLDYRLVETLAALPSTCFFMRNKGKQLLRAAMGRRLPDAVLRHRKWGFGVPWRQYFRQETELRSMINEVPESSLLMDSPLCCSAVQSLIRDFTNGDDKPFPIIMELLMACLAWEVARTTASENPH